MEWVLTALICVQIAAFTYAIHMAFRHNRSLLNAVIAKSSYEFQTLERQPRRKTRKKIEPVQDDAGIPHGL